MRQDLLGVLQALGHLCVPALEGAGERMLALLAFEIDVGHQFLLTGQDDLCFVGEVDLDYLVAESEHDGVFGLHPLLDVAAGSLRWRFLIGLSLGICIEIVAEMLEQGNLLL